MIFLPFWRKIAFTCHFRKIEAEFKKSKFWFNFIFFPIQIYPSTGKLPCPKCFKAQTVDKGSIVDLRTLLYHLIASCPALHTFSILYSLVIIATIVGHQSTSLLYRCSSFQQFSILLFLVRLCVKNRTPWWQNIIFVFIQLNECSQEKKTKNQIKSIRRPKTKSILYTIHIKLQISSY